MAAFFFENSRPAALLLAALILLVALGSCGDGQDSEGKDSEGERFGSPSYAYVGPTACEDFLEAERAMRADTFSTAHVYYESAVAKLANGDPRDDGDCPPGTLSRARYGASLTLLTIPLGIIEGFLGSWAAGDDHAVERFLTDWYRETHGGEDPPVSLITDYMTEIILPQMDQGTGWIDAVTADPEFYYALPEFRLLFFGQGLIFPDLAIDGRGEHDLGEAALVSLVLHLGDLLARTVYAYNLDLDANNFDALLHILIGGDLETLFEILEDYPLFLTLREGGDAGIDGREQLAIAKADLAVLLGLIVDDDNDDGDYSGFGELPDDLLDAVRAETDDQIDDILGYAGGRFTCNFRVAGSRADELGCGLILDALPLVLGDPLMEAVTHATLGWFPPEPRPRNGLDDDVATGYVSEVRGSRMTDHAAWWAPGALVGKILNPSVYRVLATGENLTYTIVENTEREVIVAGDMEGVAFPGDLYSIGDGEIDDAPVDLTPVLSLLSYPSWPAGAGLTLLPSAFFDLAPDLRDLLPAWDAELGDPDFFGLVVDRTETFTDIDGDGRYDPEVDVLHDAPHAYGPWSYPEDGLFQPFYLYFADPTFGGVLGFEGILEHAEPADALNLVLSQILGLLFPQQGGRLP